jgi:two-component system, NarL family, nitrate/nitrite response regulator NarL
VDHSGARGGSLRVLVVESRPLLASALAGILDSEPDLALCGLTRGGAEAVAYAARDTADVIVINFDLSDMSGPTAAGMIHDQIPQATIVFYSADESETALLDAIDAGAIAYLTKSATADQLLEAIRRAALGEVLIPVTIFARALARQRAAQADAEDHKRHAAIFTSRELEVLSLLGEGLDTATMSKRLGIASHTIEWHVRHVIEKLEVHSKLQAVIAGARLGLIDVTKN